MASSAPLSRVLKGLRSIVYVLEDHLHSLPDDHPLHIALRTYALSLSLSLGPSLLSPLLSRKARDGRLKALASVLQRELGISGFAFAMSVGVGGGSALKYFWDVWEDQNIPGLPFYHSRKGPAPKLRRDGLKSCLA